MLQWQHEDVEAKTLKLNGINHNGTYCRRKRINIRAVWFEMEGNYHSTVDYLSNIAWARMLLCWISARFWFIAGRNLITAVPIFSMHTYLCDIAFIYLYKQEINITKVTFQIQYGQIVCLLLLHQRKQVPKRPQSLYSMFASLLISSHWFVPPMFPVKLASFFFFFIFTWWAFIL